MFDTNFYPITMDTEAFITEVVNEYLTYRYYYDNIIDLLDVTLDDYVSNNKIEDNKKIIDVYAGDVFNSIKMYEKYFGSINEIHSKTSDYFYQQLAYIALFVKIYPEITNNLPSSSTISSEEESFSLDDVNDDVADIYNEMIDIYNSRYELGIAV